jgi:DNA end-binding protein Ku
MRGKDMVALGRIVLAKRERVMMLQAWDKGLMGTTLRYPYEVRDPATYFGDIPEIAVPKDMLTLAEHILDSKAADFDPAQFHDRYEEAVVAMLRKKQAGLPTATAKPTTGPTSNVVDLMEALKRSIAGTPKPAEILKVKKPRKRNEDQREMLLPISGSKPKEAATKKPVLKTGAKPSAGRRAG